LNDLAFFTGALLAANLIARKLTADAPSANRSLSTSVADAREPLWKKHLHSAGLWSFSIYLVHEPLLEAFGRVVSPRVGGIPGGRWFVFLASVALWFVVAPLCGLIYRWVELPSVAFGKRFLRPAMR